MLTANITYRNKAPAPPKVQITQPGPFPLVGKVLPGQVTLAIAPDSADSPLPAPAGSIARMCVWNTDSLAECAAAGFVPFAASVPWALAAGAGERKVYVWLRDDLGRDSAAGVGTGTVNPKLALMLVNGNTSFTNTNLVDLQLLAAAAEM